jgi:hypothetical protein
MRKPQGDGSDILKAIIKAIMDNPAAEKEIVESAGGLFDNIPGFKEMIRGAAGTADEAAPAAVKAAKKSATPKNSKSAADKAAAKLKKINDRMDRIEAHSGVRPTAEFAALPKAERRLFNQNQAAAKRAQAAAERAEANAAKSAANKAAFANPDEAAAAELARRKDAKEAFWARQKELNTEVFKKSEAKKAAPKRPRKPRKPKES